MCADPIGERLRPSRLGVGIARRAKDGDEDLGRPQFAGLPVLNRHGLARVIDEEFLARPMLLPQTPIQGGPPGAIEIAKTAVLIAVGMLRLILLPEQRQGDALPRQFLMHGRPIRHRPRRAGRRGGRRIQPGFQLLIV